MKQQTIHRRVLAATLALAAGAAVAQGNAALDGIAKYREMLQDGNPAELFEAKGGRPVETETGSEGRHAGAM